MEQHVAELPVFERTWAWFEANKKQVIWIAAAIIVVGAVAGFYFWRLTAVQFAASEALAAVEAQVSAPGSPRSESAESYLKVANEHAGTLAAARALLQAGAVHFTQGKYAEAQTVFQRFLREYPESQYRQQALLGNAASLEALGKAEEAVAAYQSVSQQASGSAIGNQARFALARIYESQGRLAQALPIYEELSRADQTGSIGNEAGLRAEELRSKLPPPSAAVTNAPAPALITVPPTAAPAAAATNQP